MVKRHAGHFDSERAKAASAKGLAARRAKKKGSLESERIRFEADAASWSVEAAFGVLAAAQAGKKITKIQIQAARIYLREHRLADVNPATVSERASRLEDKGLV